MMRKLQAARVGGALQVSYCSQEAAHSGCLAGYRQTLSAQHRRPTISCAQGLENLT